MATQPSNRAKKKTVRPDSQAELKESLNRAWIAGRDVLNQAMAEVRPDLRALGKKGLASAKGTVEEARSFAGGTLRKIESLVDDKVAAALDRFGVPSRDEIRTLSRRVADLTAKVEKLSPSRARR